MNWASAFAFACALAADLILFGGTAYAVFWLGYSGWWFLLTIFISAGCVPSFSSQITTRKAQ